MKTKRVLFLVPLLGCLALVAFGGCPPSPSSATDAPTGVADAQPQEVAAADAPVSDDPYGCVAACKALADIPCVEGGPSCVPTCTAVESNKLADFHTKCLASAKSAAAARACKSVSCPQ